jgi:hypothetical protein
MKKIHNKRFIFVGLTLSALVMSPHAFCTDATSVPNTNTTPSSIPTSSAAAPSSAAISACADKEKGDACDFTNEKGDSVNGHCGYTGSDQSKLVCVVYQ